MQDVSALGYLTYHAGGGYIGGYASFGQSNFKDINRHITIGTAHRTETGKADGSHLGGGVTGGWWFDFSTLRTGPFATVERSGERRVGKECGSPCRTRWPPTH